MQNIAVKTVCQNLPEVVEIYQLFVERAKTKWIEHRAIFKWFSVGTKITHKDSNQRMNIGKGIWCK